MLYTSFTSSKKKYDTARYYKNGNNEKNDNISKDMEKLLAGI